MLLADAPQAPVVDYYAGAIAFLAVTMFARRLRAYQTPIDKMLSLPPQRATLELVPDRGAEPRPDGL
jgi:hypothetical protein